MSSEDVVRALLAENAALKRRNAELEHIVSSARVSSAPPTQQPATQAVPCPASAQIANGREKGKAGDDRWNNFQAALQSFVDREGHCRVPQRHVENGYNLGTAVCHVRSRQQYLKGRPERRPWLERLGFPFETGMSRDKRWQKFRAALMAFRAREGHCRVPHAHIEAGYNLGSVIYQVRSCQQVHIKGHPERREWLVQMGFEFKKSKSRDERWARFQAALTAFRDREGHCRVPQRHVEDGYNLGQTVSHVRSQQQYLKGHPDRREWLEQLGFVFEKGRPWDQKWAKFQTALQRFIDREGHCRVPSAGHVEDGFNLSTAVYHVRNSLQYVKGQPARRQWLERLGFDFEKPKARDKRWARFQAALERYHTREGHCRVPYAHVEDGYNLGMALHGVQTKQAFLKGHDDRRRWLVEMGVDLGGGLVEMAAAAGRKRKRDADLGNKADHAEELATHAEELRYLLFRSAGSIYGPVTEC